MWVGWKTLTRRYCERDGIEMLNWFNIYHGIIRFSKIKRRQLLMFDDSIYINPQNRQLTITVRTRKTSIQQCFECMQCLIIFYILYGSEKFFKTVCLNIKLKMVLYTKRVALSRQNSWKIFSLSQLYFLVNITWK